MIKLKGYAHLLIHENDSAISWLGKALETTG